MPPDLVDSAPLGPPSVESAAPVIEETPIPSMDELDALVAELDRIDATLAALA